MSKSSRFRCNFSLHSSQVVTASKEEPGGEGQGESQCQVATVYNTIIQASQTVTSFWLYFAGQG